MAEKPQYIEIEEKVREFWKQAGTFQKSVEKEAPNGDYSFYDGPPFATGTMHYGHMVGQIMKDVVPRFWTMNGYRVERRWGWDCHGLPVENLVEKELGISNKQQIVEMGIEKFNELCRSKVLSYVPEWKQSVEKLGRWVDMENDYKTMDLSFMESVWFVFKKLYDQGLIYEGYRSMYVCPRCETTLSQAEVSEGYKDIKDLSVVAKFELIDEPGTFLLAWTTTPWTLPGNVALAVGKDIEYLFAEITDVSMQAHTKEPGEKVSIKFISPQKYYVSKKFVENLDKNKYHVEIIRKYKGSDLVGKSFKPLYNYYSEDQNLENCENGWKVYAAEFVSEEEGTGIVHIAPGYGEDDLNLGKEHKLPFVQHVGMNGVMKKEVIDFAGLHVKPIEDVTSTDVAIIKYLAANGLLFFKEKYEHSYPHCWRCETPLINYATSSWFVSVTKLKEDNLLLETAKTINWSPDYIKEGRFGNWLEGARDWSISRQRFWASVIPIWRCEECSALRVFGSVKDLEEASGQKVTDLHKHIVDTIAFSCSCGKTMRRVPDVLDTWFDSGSMPYAQMHYNFENKEKFEKNFPANFIAEGIDQTRTWFYYLHVLATGLFKKAAFQNVAVNGTVLAEDGKKMSKRLQNYPDPNILMDQYGADALRAYFLSAPVMQAENMNFSEKGVQEALRKNIMILWNVYAFYEMYAGDEKSDSESSNILDQWILVRLQQLISLVSEAMENYNLPKAMRPITEFIDDLSTWYLRRSRDRFKEEGDDKQAALKTMKFVLTGLSEVMAPFTPFVAEGLWQKVTGNNFGDTDKSVHLQNWPKMRTIDEAVIGEMTTVRKIVEMGLAERDNKKVKVRQPLQKIVVTSKTLKTDNQNLVELIKDELNIKKVIFQSGEEDSVELDVVMTPALEKEGLKREIVRLVNQLRKEQGLTIEDRIMLYWWTDEEMVKGVFDDYGEDIKSDVLAQEVILEKKEQAKENKINNSIIYLLINKN
jgi:isoleucyl-tRNA synthetase